MSKKIDEQEQKAIEEYLSSIPEQLAEDDDEHLAQKGLSYLQSQNQMPVGDVLIKNRKRNAVVISLAVLVLLVCICTPLIVLTRENPDNIIYYDESRIYFEGVDSVTEYNRENHTGFLSFDAMESIVDMDCQVYRFAEDGTLAYIRTELIAQSDVLYLELEYYIKQVSQALSILDRYNYLTDHTNISDIEISFSMEMIDEMLYHTYAAFEYNGVSYYLNFQCTDENGLEQIVTFILESAE